MKIFLIFLVLLITCCNLFPTIAPEDIGDKFIGNDGFLSSIFDTISSIADKTFQIITDPLEVAKDLVYKIFNPLKEFLDSITGRS